jgi:hypothetical protein
MLFLGKWKEERFDEGLSFFRIIYFLFGFSIALVFSDFLLILAAL